MTYKKITNGYVVQEYDGPTCVRQEFIASSATSEYEDEEGNAFDVDETDIKAIDCPLHMIQP